jgi:hypothetical protein
MEAENQDIRPQFLKVLCILSWINAGITIISSSLYKMMSGTVAQSLDFISDETLKKEMLLQIEFLNGNSIWIVLLYLLSILGVFLMWNRNRNGFYIYIAVNVSLVLLPFTFFPFSAMDLISSSLVTVAFIYMYSRNLFYINS